MLETDGRTDGRMYLLTDTARCSRVSATQKNHKKSKIWLTDQLTDKAGCRIALRATKNSIHWDGQSKREYSSFVAAFVMRCCISSLAFKKLCRMSQMGITGPFRMEVAAWTRHSQTGYCLIVVGWVLPPPFWGSRLLGYHSRLVVLSETIGLPGGELCVANRQTN